jgi:hypothetical protein
MRESGTYPTKGRLTGIRWWKITAGRLLALQPSYRYPIPSRPVEIGLAQDTRHHCAFPPWWQILPFTYEMGRKLTVFSLGTSWHGITDKSPDRLAPDGGLLSWGRRGRLHHDPQSLPDLRHVLLKEVLLDVVHIEFTPLDVGLLDVGGRVDRRTRRDQ